VENKGFGLIVGALRDPVTLLFTLSFRNLNSIEEQFALEEALLR
jgi:hypothetical protein